MLVARVRPCQASLGVTICSGYPVCSSHYNREATKKIRIYTTKLGRADTSAVGDHVSTHDHDDEDALNEGQDRLRYAAGDTSASLPAQTRSGRWGSAALAVSALASGAGGGFASHASGTSVGGIAAAAAAVAMVVKDEKARGSGGDGQSGLSEIGQDVLGRWLDLMSAHGDLVRFEDCIFFVAENLAILSTVMSIPATKLRSR